jgi:hypothetical protein
VRIFFMSFQVSPRPDTPSFATAGGAYINCWIAAAAFEDAQLRARSLITEAGWLIGKLEISRVAAREDYRDAPDGLAYFEQALVDREVLVIHTWPAEPQDGDPVH